MQAEHQAEVEGLRKALEPFAGAARHLVLEPGESFQLPDDAPLGEVLNKSLQPTLGHLRTALASIASLEAQLAQYHRKEPT